MCSPYTQYLIVIMGFDDSNRHFIRNLIHCEGFICTVAKCLNQPSKCESTYSDEFRSWMFRLSWLMFPWFQWVFQCSHKSNSKREDWYCYVYFPDYLMQYTLNLPDILDGMHECIALNSIPTPTHMLIPGFHDNAIYKCEYFSIGFCNNNCRTYDYFAGFIPFSENRSQELRNSLYSFHCRSILYDFSSFLSTDLIHYTHFTILTTDQIDSPDSPIGKTTHRIWVKMYEQL